MSDRMDMEKPTAQVMEEQRSVFNPTDIAAMGQQGKVRPDMTVEEYLVQLGINPKGPVKQLVNFAKQQMRKANPMNKMQALAESEPKAAPMPPQQGQARQMPQGQPKGGGMSDLLKNMK